MEMEKKQKTVLKLFYLVIFFVILFIGYNVYVYMNKFTLDKKKYNMSVNAEYTMVVYGYKGKIQNNKNFKFEVDDDSVVEVDEEGTIKPKKVGSVNLTVTSKRGNNKRKTTITVLDEDAEQILLNSYSVVLNEGDTYKINYNVNGDKDLVYNMIYRSSNPNVAKVDKYGNIEAISKGKAIITISTSNGITAECYVKVNSKNSGSTSNKQDDDDDDVNIVYTYDPNTNTTNNTSYNNTSYNSSTDIPVDNDTDAVVIDPDSDTPIVVNPVDIKPTEVKLDSTSLVIKKGTTSTITAIVLPVGASNRSVTWKSSNSNIVSVDKNGIITAKNYGTATITATAVNKISASVTVNVKNDNVAVSGITLGRNSAEVYVGSTIGISSTVTPSNATDKSIIWSSSNPNVATVSNGVVRGIKAGIVYVTATTKNGKKATCTIIVKDVPATSITLNKTSDTIHVGESNNLVVTLKPANVTNKSLTWTSSDNSVATVTNGKVVGKKEGNVTITVKTSNNKVATCNIKVIKKNTKIYAEAIQLSTSSISLLEGNTYTLKANIMPNNTTDKTIKWSSSNTKVATVSNGKVVATGPGSAVITATTSNGKSASATVEVKRVNLIEAYFLNSMTNGSFKYKYTNNNAFIIRTNTGKYILVDTGMNKETKNNTDTDEVANLIYNKLKSLQNNNKVVIDYMIISHLDNDHYGNAKKLLKNTNINIKNMIIKREASKASTYDSIVSAAGNTKVIQANNLSEGIGYALDSNTKMYLFNVKDVFANNSNCTDYKTTDYAINFVNSTKHDILRDTNGKYIYIEGSELPNAKIRTTDKVEFKQAGINSRFYAISFENNNCRSNSNSIAVLFQTVTGNGTKYMYMPGDLENNGYSFFGEYDSNYNKTIHGVVSTYYYEYQLVNGVPRYIVNNNQLVKSTKTKAVRMPSEYLTAKRIRDRFGNINITVYQQSHHGLNNSQEAIETLNLNRSNVYSIVPVNADPRAATSIRTILSQHYLRNTKMMYSGASGIGGIKCTINTSSATTCASY